jgi:multidrug efflux pump subunit AcrB
MTKKIGTIAAMTNALSVAAFAVSMIVNWLFVSYISSIFIALSFVPMVCAFAAKGRPETKAAGFAAIAFASIYTTFILLVYFTQITTLQNESLSREIATLLDYTAFSWFFNLNLLGYGFMSLSTFFAAFTINAHTKPGKFLKYMLAGHGIFAVTCFTMPILGIFSNLEGADFIGTLVLLAWCVIFLPIGLCAVCHFLSRD